MELKPGWLDRQMNETEVEVATWSEALRSAAGFTDEGLTLKQRKEAATRLRKRADELDPEGIYTAKQNPPKAYKKQPSV